LNQAELQQMAEERIKDAKALLDAGRWEFAYYVAGYSIECALKSCVLSRMVVSGWVFKEQTKKVDECRVHDFNSLIAIAHLKDELNARLQASAAANDGFVTNWNAVGSWTVTSRYQPRSEAEARALYAAITAEPHGVMRWIRNYW
jgi:HEPN domain